jgi:MYXO-CTERM domain-containing protein
MREPFLRRRSSSHRPIATLWIGAGLLALGACGQRAESDPSRPTNLRTTARALVAQEQLYTGGDLGSKELALTFDDGPGPLAVTGGLSTWLKNRPVPIHATFFVNGACIATTPLHGTNCTPVANATDVLAQVVADGNLIGNHTTTHRDLVSEVPDEERVQELAETDDLIAPYVPWNRFLFRAPYGYWADNTSPTPYETISASAMNKYTGPIYWTIGGGPTTATQAADWECWNKGFTSKHCGDLYLAEIHTYNKGIVLMHDATGVTSNHDIDNGTGNTVDMVKYVVQALEAEGGWKFKTLDQVPAIAAALPSCHASCASCSGPAANQCTGCSGNNYLSAGTCTGCSTCDAGTYTVSACTAAANTVCANCDASCAGCSGAGAAACTSCSSGKYLSGGACKACSACGAGFFQSAACTTTTDAVCAPCDAACATCSGAGPSACLGCVSGKYLSGGACATCATCGPGFFQSAACTATTNTVCGACHASCTACSGPDISQCGSCPAGFYLSGGACVACSKCAAGSYEAVACTTNANTLCVQCARGTFSNEGATACEPCPTGTFASSPGSTACTSCGSCEDSHLCTSDVCSATVGCIHTPSAGCSPPDDAGRSTIVDASSSAEGAPSGGSAQDGCSASGGPSSSSITALLGALGVALARRRRRADDAR